MSGLLYFTKVKVMGQSWRSWDETQMKLWRIF